MRDLNYNIETGEVVLKNGDFDIIANSSVQNGSIMLQGHGFNCFYPTYGVGLNNFLGSSLSNVALKLNLWQQQCKNDGAKLAQWNNAIDNNPYSNAQFKTVISYV